MKRSRPRAGAPRTASRTGRQAVLDLLRDADGPLTTAQIAARLGLHVNTVRFHLVRLVESHLASERQAAPAGRGRPHLVYTAVPAPDRRPAGPGGDGADRPVGADGYPLLAEILAGYLGRTSADPGAAAEAAGREWGRYLADRPPPFREVTRQEAVSGLTAVLDRLGFAPEPAGDRMLLHACPFRLVADRLPDVVCSVHLGLMRGALAEGGGTVAVRALEPHAPPAPCVALLATEPGGTG